MADYNSWESVLDVVTAPISESATRIVFANNDGTTFTVINGSFVENDGLGTGFDHGLISSVVRTTDAAGNNDITTITGKTPGDMPDVSTLIATIDHAEALATQIGSLPDVNNLPPASWFDTQFVLTVIDPVTGMPDGTTVVITGSGFGPTPTTEDEFEAGISGGTALSLAHLDSGGTPVPGGFNTTFPSPGEPWQHIDNAFSFLSGDNFALNQDVFGQVLAGDNIISTNLDDANPAIPGDTDDQIFGTIDGGAGDDILNASNGSGERFAGGEGDDVINANGDIVDYSLASAGVNVDLSAGTATDDGDGGVDTLNNVQSVEGSEFDDTIIGDSSSNEISAREGDDDLTGNGGADSFEYDLFDGVLDIGEDVVVDFETIAGGDILRIANYNTGNGHTNDVNSLADLTITDSTIPAGRPGEGDDAAKIEIPGVTGAIFVAGTEAAVLQQTAVGTTSGVNGSKYISFDFAEPVGYQQGALACFPAGTMIATADGERAIETLREGDLLVTLTGESKPLSFLGVITTQPHPVRGHSERNKPIIIKAGAFGPGAPEHDLTTSWWHGIMLQGPWIEKWFGEPRVITNDEEGRLIGKNLDKICAEQFSVALVA